MSRSSLELVKFELWCPHVEVEPLLPAVEALLDARKPLVQAREQLPHASGKLVARATAGAGGLHFLAKHAAWVLRILNCELFLPPAASKHLVDERKVA